MQTIRTLPTITALDPTAWDALIGEDSTASYGWLKTVEECHRGELEPRYTTLVHDGAIVAAAIGAVLRPSHNVYTVNDVLLSRYSKSMERVGLSFLPALVCSPLHGKGTGLVVAPSVPEQERDELARTLLDELEREARHEGLPLIFTAVRAEDRWLTELLRSRGYCGTHGAPECILDIPWSSFREYCDHVQESVSKRTRRNIGNQIRRNERSGVTIRRLGDNPDDARRAYELLDLSFRRLNGRPFIYREGYLHRLKENLGDRAVVYTAFKDGNMTGAAVQIRGGTVASQNAIGIDHDRSGNDFTYFVLGYYRPIEDAIEDGVKRLYFGMSLYELKARRGCAIMPVSIFHTTASRLKRLAVRPWFALHRWTWERKKLPHMLNPRGAL